MLLRTRSSWPKRSVREARRAFVRNNWPLLVAIGLMWAAGGWAIRFLMHGYVLGLTQGVFAATAVAGLVVIQLGVSGTFNALLGTWGEDNTRSELKTSQRRGHVFGFVDNLEVQSGDVDHLVATSSGWFAIDSKWHGASASLEVLKRDVSSAREAARRAHLILRSEGHRCEVTPLVVVWGGAQHLVPHGSCTVGGVAVVAGRHLKQHLRELPPGTLCGADVLPVLAKLHKFREREQPTSRRSGQRPDGSRQAIFER